MRVSKIKVNTLNQSYNVIVGKNLSNNFSKILKNNLLNYKKCLFVIDKKVPKKIVNKICQSFKNKEKFFYFFKSNEINKNFKSINKILNILLKNNFHRNDCLISIGGGITGDVSGFAASILKRGIKFINIPTTLLAQVDSSIGGKTGINSKYGKNLIGSFYQPSLVVSDINFLKSLPKREIVCGYAEILKHSLIKNKKLFVFLDKNGKNILKLENNYLRNLSVHVFDENYNNLFRIEAQNADINKNIWKLNNVSIYNKLNNHSKLYFDTYPLNTNFNKHKIRNLFSNLDAISLWNLKNLKKNYEIIGYSTKEIDIQFQKEISYPFFLMSMTLLAGVVIMFIPFKGGYLNHATISVILSVIIFYLNDFSKALGKTESISMIMSVWTPLILILSISLIGLIYVNEK